ncbi:hypothetical protein GGH94_001485 [Coemansia aciculifera]|uniref:Uncharacterized protein n=1 Tax=Coemansia aciculifera TaxID=417176 RepID=A0A9W8M4X3_9FUNG|nr:hypothetical protein GGH94_001485 [Coemansia aciculifera]
MVFSVYNDSDYTITSRTAYGVYWQTVIPGTSTQYFLRDRVGRPDNLVLIASEYGLFYGEIAEGQHVRVKNGNRISYHSADGRIVEDYFAEQVFASDLREYRVGHQELMDKVAEMYGSLSIEAD